MHERPNRRLSNRDLAVCVLLEEHAQRVSASSHALRWGMQGAFAALDDGRTCHFAIETGKERIDEADRLLDDGEDWTHHASPRCRVQPA